MPNRGSHLYASWMSPSKRLDSDQGGYAQIESLRSVLLFLFGPVQTGSFTRVGITNWILPKTVKALQRITIKRVRITFTCINLADSGGRFLNDPPFHFCICVGIDQSGLRMCVAQPLEDQYHIHAGPDCRENSVNTNI